MAAEALEAQRGTGDQRLVFPPGFRWGVATASHQYEGNTLNNQWTAWERAGGIRSGDQAGLACDWWRNAERDFDLAQEMGLNALRLSLEWSRIEPRAGEWDDTAISRYREMLTGLRERGIEPMVTLHHFTHPLWFEQRGAFLSRDAVERFTRYVAHVVSALGDLCDFWCTINEPNVYSAFGYELGDFPPGRRGDLWGALRSQMTMALAHAAAYREIHRLQPAARVGWAHHYNVFTPAHPSSPFDRLVAGLQDAVFNDFFPRAVRTGTAVFPLSLAARDLNAVRGTCDFVGINVYYRDLVRFDMRSASQLFGKRFPARGAIRSDQPVGEELSEVFPQGIAQVARRAAEFGVPVYVTENGVADREDRVRPWLIVQAAKAMHGTIADGVDLRGYYHWSLVDDFEWAQGWKLRFGLYALDVASQQRVKRPSARLYGAIARANALSEEMVREFAPDALADIFTQISAG